jgi:hypothetical protein
MCEHTSSRFADAIAVVITPAMCVHQAPPPALPVRTSDGTVLTEKTAVGPAGNCHFVIIAFVTVAFETALFHLVLTCWRAFSKTSVNVCPDC